MHVVNHRPSMLVCIVRLAKFVSGPSVVLQRYRVDFPRCHCLGILKIKMFNGTWFSLIEKETWGVTFDTAPRPLAAHVRSRSTRRPSVVKGKKLALDDRSCPRLVRLWDKNGHMRAVLNELENNNIYRNIPSHHPLSSGLKFMKKGGWVMLSVGKCKKFRKS